MLEVLDVSGRRVARFGPLADDAAWRSVTWRGERESGERAEPGVYLVRLVAGGAVASRRVVLLPR